SPIGAPLKIYFLPGTPHGAGLIPVVHASGGPIMDIVTPLDGKPTGKVVVMQGPDLTGAAQALRNRSPVKPRRGQRLGFLATTAEEFASQLYAALSLSQNESMAMRDRARRKSREFSTEEFEKGFRALWEAIQKS
ncbi:7148_t:CDS:2, partial [Acaulospora colombiana]